MKPLRLVVVDDHALFRAGLISLLNDMPEFSVVGEANNGSSAMDVIHLEQPDVILLDVNMLIMGGVDTVRELKKGDSPKILMLTISKSDEDLLGAISAGADGYLLKSSEPEELRKAIISVNQGMAVLAPQIKRQVLDTVNTEPVRSPESELSDRELEVLGCLARGRTTAQIAFELFISENTVKTHVRHILEKLEASNRAEAVSKAIQLGIIGQMSQ